MALGAIDIGTNSVRLLITDRHGNGLERHMEITRLGEGVDVHGTLSPPAIARTVEVLERYGQRLRAREAEQVRVTATSAARDASNRETFFQQVEHATGHRPELLSGEAEAALSFAGATFDVAKEDGPFLVVDIGGGSTEFVLGERHPEHLISVDMGCVRLSERFLKDDPPSPDQIDACCREIRRLLQEVRKQIPVARCRTLLGLAGSVTTLASLHAGLDRYDPSRTHGMWLPREAVDHLCAQLLAAPVAERRQMLTEPRRAEVIAGGTLVLRELMHEFEVSQVRVSEHDILDGLAASLRETSES